MKIFIDTANIVQIKSMHALGIVDGVTTNPSLIAKENRNFREIVDEICGIVKGPVSVEAVKSKAEEIIPEARELSKIAPNIVVKIPMTKEGLKAVNVLSCEGIKTNMTLIFSANQAILAAKAGAAYVSPFIGRLDDIGHDGMQIVKDIVQIYRNYDEFETEVIVASIRHPLHVIDAAKCGAHISTIPFDVIDKMIKHPLTDAGIEKFNADWEKSKNL